VAHRESRVLAGLQIDLEILPEQRVVRLDAMPAGRDFPRGLLPEKEGGEPLAVDAQHDLAIADIVLLLARDGDSRTRRFCLHVPSVTCVRRKNLPTRIITL